MPSSFFHFKNSTLHYTTLGSGPQNLFMFHGFGQDNNSFRALSGVLSNHYTAYVFDLYFHGQSKWAHGEKPLEKIHWKETLHAFLQKYRIESFFVAGYSLGGKFALATLEAFPEMTKGVILLAPDGIKSSFWYTLATYPVLIRKVFRSMIHHPERFQSVIKMLYAWKLVDKGVLKFAEFQMNSEEKRSRVYYSWVVFRHLNFDLHKIASMINEAEIPITIVVGKYDKVIRPKNMERFVSLLNNCVFETPEAGHTGLISESGTYFKNLKPSS
jgi:pimeloyl-ACP methyl ester carboxylesterase